MIPVISSHALLSTEEEIPTIFTIPSSYTLDRLISYQNEVPQIPTSLLHPPHPPSSPPPPPLPTLSLVNFCNPKEPKSLTQIAVSEAIRVALESEVPGLPPPSPIASKCTHSSSIFLQDNSKHVSIDLNTMPAAPVEKVVSISHFDREVALGPMLADQDDAYHPIVQELCNLRDSSDSIVSKFIAPPVTYFDASKCSSSMSMGNLLLSSCPGKKVRLHGPTRGRPPVCRDLESDLARIKASGVGCIVCCLDDNELDFLGAPWSEYSAIAQRLGLDVLRIPTPEGLPPLSSSPATLDEQLSRLIEEYTLQNVSVLVHCRGGVGRAGVIACCWLLKLGLCGSLRREQRSCEDCLIDHPSEEVLNLVQTVIDVVRKRRSIKAIETYEQVRFVVDYLLYLGNDQLRRLCSDLDELGSVMVDSPTPSRAVKNIFK